MPDKIDTKKRRKAVMAALEQTKHPITASLLAKQFSVSRQIIVGDIALLRAEGIPILSTPRGYLLETMAFPSGIRHMITCRHTKDEMQQELYAIVDNSCDVLDVIVEHPVYGKLSGALRLSSRYDVDTFLKSCNETNAPPLSALTEGLHVHTILAPDEAALKRVRDQLKKLGFLVE